MKELTDKVNMDNLSLIIKTLRSKATSSTFFNKSNTKQLLKLAVAFYQFKDKSLEELIFTDAKYDESGCHDSFLDDLIKCINSDEIKNSNKYFVLRQMSSLIYFLHHFIIFSVLFINKLSLHFLNGDLQIGWFLCWVITTTVSVAVSYIIVKLSQKPRLKFLKILYT